VLRCCHDPAAALPAPAAVALLRLWRSAALCCALLLSAAPRAAAALLLPLPASGLGALPVRQAARGAGRL
jgi:hypothetical protein